jgi:hypothetical protein
LIAMFAPVIGGVTRGPYGACGRRSAFSRNGLENGIAIAGQARTLESGRELFQCDQLAFQQRVKLRAIQSDLIGGVLHQHQGGEFMGTQHYLFPF